MEAVLTTVLKILLEQGVLGVICVLLLLGYIKRDKAYLDLYARFSKHLADDNVRRSAMNRELVGAVSDLNTACERCGYRKFVERVGASGDGE